MSEMCKTVKCLQLRILQRRKRLGTVVEVPYEPPARPAPPSTYHIPGGTPGLTGTSFRGTSGFGGIVYNGDDNGKNPSDENRYQYENNTIGVPSLPWWPWLIIAAIFVGIPLVAIICHYIC